MISESKKQLIADAIEREGQLLGSMKKVADKLGISGSTISANVKKKDNWGLIAESTWAKIASALGVSLIDREWNVVGSQNLRIMHSALAMAQKESLFLSVSEKAGSGKTTAIAAYKKADELNSVFVLQCEEWGRRSFLQRLSKELGIVVGKYDAAEEVIENIVQFFKQRASIAMPLLILDEADKLKPMALRFIIPLYNRLKDELGLVIVGTDNLEKEIKAGVKRQEKGYDEIDSRLGRSFVHLKGADMNDVKMICEANGISDQDTIEHIWNQSNPTRKQAGKGHIQVCEDLRAVERKIKRERMKLNAN